MCQQTSHDGRNNSNKYMLKKTFKKHKQTESCCTNILHKNVFDFTDYQGDKHNAELQRTDPGTKVTGEFSTRGHIFSPNV